MKAKQTNKFYRLRQAVRRDIKMVLIPHRENQYRPHLIRRYALIGIMATTITGQMGYNFVATGAVLGQEASMTINNILADTNSERAHHRLPSLKLNSRLSQAAYLKAQDMLRRQYWSHIGPDGSTPWRWFGDVGYSYTYAGENLAKDFRTSNAVVTAWMASPEHRANILDQYYIDVGFAILDGVLEGKSSTIVVALYGAPASEGVAGISAPGSALESRSLGIVSRLGVAVQSMSPAAIGSLFLLLMVAGVSLLAHAYRKKLPKTLRSSWYRHHGLVKAGGVLALCFIIVLYSNGQI